MAAADILKHFKKYDISATVLPIGTAFGMMTHTLAFRIRLAVEIKNPRCRTAAMLKNRKM